MSKIAIALTVNGEPRQVLAEPREQLADLLRGGLMLTGTHVGCEHGVCGACTVEIDGVPMRSCITHAGSCDGAVIRTIEGFDEDAVMAALREAFAREHALQCGYCTPGKGLAQHSQRLPATFHLVWPQTPVSEQFVQKDAVGAVVVNHEDGQPSHGVQRRPGSGNPLPHGRGSQGRGSRGRGSQAKAAGEVERSANRSRCRREFPRSRAKAANCGLPTTHHGEDVRLRQRARDRPTDEGHDEDSIAP